MKGGPNLWVRAYRLTPTPRLRLACFAHAGGSASFFRSWTKFLPEDIDLLALQYPGREDRFNEPHMTDMASLAEGTFHALLEFSDSPLVLFGHSLGAALAYETALKLEQSGAPLAQLFVSAHPAPHLQRGGTMHLGSEEALLEDIRRQQCINNALLNDADLRRVFLPIVRSDYKVIETYRREKTRALKCPVNVTLGDSDTEVTDIEALGWREASRLSVSQNYFSGGHFYLVEQRARLIKHLLFQLDHSNPLSKVL
ncbi:thioesterase II family protein [Halomonas sp. AOP35-4E-18]|uniref:thioesterase II family protein n=1 Tax=Halomonas sp. AOP35-4E-18 TaxID=3457686 RepID=UPI00403316B2